MEWNALYLGISFDFIILRMQGALQSQRVEGVILYLHTGLHEILFVCASKHRQW